MNTYARRELDPPPRPLKRGERDYAWKVRQVQEWLCLHGFGTAIDGDFGPATEAALKAFQEHNTCAHESGVGPETWQELTWPMRRALRTDIPTTDARDRILYVAHEHLACRPQEVGGPNSGPWVRLYMDGHEGKEWPWCAGFATYVLRQSLGHDKWRTFSCDELGQRALGRSALVLSPDPEMRRGIPPGSLFLVRHPDAGAGRRPMGRMDWTHCGIVTAAHAEHFETVEGNTNVSGAREGTAVHARTRAFKPTVDFVLLGEGR